MKKIFFRYIASLFWPPFFFGLGVFTTLIFFGTLFDKLNVLMNLNLNIFVFGEYLLCQLPYYINQIAPMATLLGILFALGGFFKRGEWKAGFAGGYGPLYMIMPLILCSFIVAVFHFAWGEYVSPDLYMRSQKIYQYKIKKNMNWKKGNEKNVSFFTGRYMVSAALFNKAGGRMDKVVAESYKDAKLLSQISADSAQWDKSSKRWIFFSGVNVDYSSQIPVIRKFKTYESDMRAPPDNIIMGRFIPDGVNIRGLIKRMRRLRLIGSKAVLEKTLIFGKMAFALSNVAMAFIGIAIIFLFPKTNKMFNIGLAVFLGFLLWGLSVISIAAGKAEVLPPFWAGFAPVFLFLILSLIGLKKAKII